MAEDKVISYPQSGMNRDVHPSGLKEQEYTFALNANIESEDGNVNMRSNEHSTLKCTEFGGYKVIGYKNDTQTGDIYFFLANPSSGYSKIAYLRPTDNVSGLSESEIEDAVYGESDICAGMQTLITDEGDEPCLHFSIHHPVKTIEIKIEKCGKCIYWTDGYNPPRYVMVDKVFEPEAHGLYYYRYHGHRLCGEKEGDNLLSNDEFMNKYGCVLACEKLRVFPLLEQPCIDVKEMAYGGSLRAGVYQFAVALCDEFGNEKTNYSPLTNPIHVFDEHDITVRDGLWGARTNLGVRLEVTNIDRQVSHFKIAVCQNTVGKNGETQPVAEYFIEGVHPITEKTIYYFSDLNNTRTTLEHISYKRAIYNTSKGMVAVDNRLLQYGLTAEKEWNLQPVASLMGHFLQWQSSVSTGDLYKDGAACSLYTGYMRDEVYPFGIAFKTKTGYMTPVYTLVPPPSKVAREEANPEKYAGIDVAVESIDENVSVCTDNERKYIWQYINTSEYKGMCSELEQEEEAKEKKCENEITITQTIVEEAVIEKDLMGQDFGAFSFTISSTSGENIQDVGRYVSENIEKIARDNSNASIDGQNTMKRIYNFISSYNGANGNHEAQVKLDGIKFPEFPDECGCRDENKNYTCVNREESILEAPFDLIKDPKIEISYVEPKFMEFTNSSLIPVVSAERDDKKGIFFSSVESREQFKWYKTWLWEDSPENLQYMKDKVGKFDDKPRYLCDDSLLDARSPEGLMDVIMSGIRLSASYPNGHGDDISDPYVNPMITKNSVPVFQSNPMGIASYIPTGYSDTYDSNIWPPDENGSSTNTIIRKYYHNFIKSSGDINYPNINTISNAVTTAAFTENNARDRFMISRFNMNYVEKEWPGPEDNNGWHTDSYRSNDFNPTPILQKRDGELRDNISLTADRKRWKFYNRLALNAVWIKITRPKEWDDPEMPDKEKYIMLEIFGRESGSYVDAATSDVFRLSFWKNDSGAYLQRPSDFFTGNEMESDEGLESASHNYLFMTVNSSRIVSIGESYFNDNGIDEFYIAMDSPFVVSTAFLTFRKDDVCHEGDKESDYDKSVAIMMGSVMLGKTESPVCIGIREKEVDKITVSGSDISLKATVMFSADCVSCGDKPLACAARPHQYGDFSYFESIHKYPANFELWDSSRVKPGNRSYSDSKLEAARNTIHQKMDEWYGSRVNGAWVGKSGFHANGESTSTTLCQTPIRHYKFPDNYHNSFINNDTRLVEEGVEIYPVGVLINESIISVFLDYAVDSGLITQEQRDTITGYEIYRGDRRLNKSVVGCGLGYDMFSYSDSDGRINLYPNYPYNDLSNDRYHYEKGSRGSYIGHPFGKDGNIWYSFVSPDMYFGNMQSPTEISIDGYMRGMSTGVFSQVEDHPKWTILSTEAYKEANRLAFAESIAQLMSDVANAFMMVVTGTSGGILGTGLGAGTALGTLAAATAIPNILMKRATYYGKYRYDWINSFINNGPRLNYAWYYTSVGDYTSMYKIYGDEDYHKNSIRGIDTQKRIKSGIYPIFDKYKNNMLYVNNIFREESMFISLGRYDKETDEGFIVRYPPMVKYYDTSRVDDLVIRSSDNEAGRVYEHNKLLSYIMSPYIKAKRYVPNQYGDIEDISWVSAGGNCNMGTGYKYIFGGDTYISKFAMKRKIPEFINNAFRMGDMIPFPYDDYRNIGFPRYFVNYDTGETSIEYSDYETFRNHQSKALGSSYFFPNRASSFNLNGFEPDGRYVRGRFYLWFYGIPCFYVESDINYNFRLEGTQPHEKFYPSMSDYMWWTQERNVSIERDNDYRISPIYNARNTIFQQTLPATYDGKFWDCAYQRPNGVIWSRTDVSENSQTDPWLTYRPMDYHEFPSGNGSLIHMKRIESNQILARFENQVSLHNAIDVIAERTQKQSELGTGGLFASRPLEYNTTDLGYAGTQSTEMISSEFGHFWVDVKRAQVFMTDPNGRNLKELSVGIRHWLKNHLPFKILRYEIFNTTAGREMTYEDVDNKFIGLGLALGWDNRFKRVFITKRDYIPVLDKENYRFADGVFYYGNSPVSLTNSRYFKDVSFTLAYSCIKNEWISYYSFAPDYYIEQQNHFMSGLNYSASSEEEGLWSHLLTNKHFQTFYGTTFPFMLEVPVKEKYVGNTLASVEYELDARDYSTDVDYTVDRKVGLDSMIIYNETNNSGELVLIPEEKNNLYQKVSYPKITGNTSEILDTEVYRIHKLNDFFNRVKDDLNGILQWKKDENDIEKEINPASLDYGKSWMDRLRGSWFLMRVKKLITNKKIIFHWIMSETKQNNR